MSEDDESAPAPGQGDDGRGSSGAAAAARGPGPLGREAAIRVLVGTLVVAAAGYFWATSRPPPSNAGAPRAARDDEVGGEDRAARAPSYSDLMSDSARRTDARQVEAFASLVADRRALDALVPNATDEERSLELERRAALRAYEGAPPRIPHPIEQRGRPECAACHEEGMRVSGHVAPAMPHDTFVSCVQCHVVDEAPMPGAEAALASGPPVGTTFAGRSASARGPRAWAGAPPAMPHSTRMRERCSSCHGTLSTGIGSPHLGRLSCPQCHAPNAELEGVPFARSER